MNSASGNAASPPIRGGTATASPPIRPTCPHVIKRNNNGHPHASHAGHNNWGRTYRLGSANNSNAAPTRSRSTESVWLAGPAATQQAQPRNLQQTQVAQWYVIIGDNTLADAILDRLRHNAH